MTAVQARRIALSAQLLAGPRPRPDARGLVKVVRDIGYLQLDPTSVVARSHLLVLYSRVGPYDLAVLDRLLWPDRRLFEYARGAAFIFPTDDLPILANAMRQYRQAKTPRAQRAAAWIRKNDSLRRHVLSRLRADGPLPLDAFEDRSLHSWTSSGWTSERNVSQMLEFLWRQGHVTVAGRAGGRRLWALADRWLPKVRALPPGEAERVRAERTIRSLGVATARDLARAYLSPPALRTATRWHTPAILKRLEREGKVLRAQVGNGDGASEEVFMHVDSVPLIKRVASGWDGRTTLLSPFDNLIIDRDRTERLFGFRYRMEIYVPRERRRYGYFAMPILHGDRLIGRIDPRVDRERSRLVIGSVHAEVDAPRSRAAAVAIRDAVQELATFVAAREVEWPRRVPAAWAAALRPRA